MASGRGLILASASPRRRVLLSAAGVHFEASEAGLPESPPREGESPWAYVQRQAGAKAADVAAAQPQAIVLAADTVVVHRGQPLGKPGGWYGAVEMLRRLRGGFHSVLTGVAVAGPHGSARGAKLTSVRFRDYSDREIFSYVDTGSPMDKAGAYGVQDVEFAPARSVTGCYLNVVGLPICLTLDLLVRCEFALPASGRAGLCTPSLLARDATL